MMVDMELSYLHLPHHFVRLVSHPMVRRLVALTFTLLATIMLVQSSSQPMLGPAAPPGPPDLKREMELTTGHVVVFSSLVILWWWALLPNLPFGSALFVAVGFALIFGVVTELAQSVVPDRQLSLFDIGVNWTTTLLTAIILWRRR